MPTELKNIKVSWISLVKAGANKKKFIYKAADEKPPVIEREIPIAKFEEEEGLVYGIVYSPNELDTDSEFARRETIKAAAHDFLKGLKAVNVDRQHSFEKEDADVVESWTLEKGDPRFPDEPAGAWAVVIKVNDEAIRADIKAGKIEGLSMAGVADKVVHKAGTFDEMRAVDGIWELTGALERSIRAAVEDEAVEDKGAAISDNVDQFKAAILDKFGFRKSAGAGSFFRRIFTQKDKGVEDMKPEEIQKMVDDAVKAAVEALPKPITKEDMTDGIRAVVTEAMRPVVERVEKIEKASPGSAQNQQGDGGQDEPDYVAIGAEIAKAVNG